MEERVKNLEKEIKLIKERNLRVEADKAWETSYFRIFLISAVIYVLAVFVLVINALLVLLASYIVPGFIVDSFWSAFLFGIVLAIVSWVLQIFEKDN